MRERRPLEDQIKAWRSRVHQGDRVTSFFPIDYILTSKSITLLARLSRNAPEVASEDSLAAFLVWSAERKRIYAPGLLKLIMDYNSSLPPERKGLNKPEDIPYSQFCSIIDFTSSYKSRSTPSQSQSQNPPSSSSTTNKRTAPESARKASKRVKLGEISLNK